METMARWQQELLSLLLVIFPFRRVAHYWCNEKSSGGCVLHGRVDCVRGVDAAFPHSVLCKYNTVIRN